MQAAGGALWLSASNVLVCPAKLPPDPGRSDDLGTQTAAATTLHNPRDPRGLAIWPLLLGMAAFFALGGAGILPPGNVGWLAHGDLAQSYLGWAFFRDAAWALPPGANPAYGLEIGSSVYYSDSIPLLAMFFKALAPVLPTPFQYFGLWVLACLMLQAWFAWKLAGLASRDVWFRTVAVLLLVMAPPMLNRLGGHMALVAHWPLLAGLYLCLRPRGHRQGLCWALLVAAAMAMHAYLFVLVGVLWVTDLARRWRDDRRAHVARNGRRVLKEAAAVIGAAVMSAWASGLFMVSGRGMRAQGFGHYKMNLLAPFDGAGWSSLGLHVQTAAGEYEGFNYLGAGVIALALLALALFLRHRTRLTWSSRNTALLVMAIALTLLAITHVIGIGGTQLALPLPEKLVDKLQGLPVQATGRVFWVVYYLIIVAALFVLARTLRPMPLRFVLLCVLALQAADLAPRLTTLRHSNLARAQMGLPDELRSAFWDEAARKYRNVRRLPTKVIAPGWEPVAFYAQQHRLGTDMVQVARLDVKPFWQLEQRKRAALFAGVPESDSLFLLGDEVLDLARAALADPRDALFRLDGRIVLAPDRGTSLPAGAQDLRSGDAARDAGSFALPYRADFSQGNQARSLLGADGERINAPQHYISMPGAALYVPAGHDASATLHARFELQALAPAPTAAKLTVLFEGTELAQVAPDGAGRYRVAVDVPPAKRPAHFRRLDLRFDLPAGSEKQQRKWKVGIEALEVSVAGGQPRGELRKSGTQ